MPSYARENLVFLRFAGNTCYVGVVAELPADVQLDLQNGKWTHLPTKRTQEIGEDRFIGRHGGKSQHATIGVYDRSKIKHLSSMAWDAGEAVQDEESMIDDM